MMISTCFLGLTIFFFYMSVFSANIFELTAQIDFPGIFLKIVQVEVQYWSFLFRLYVFFLL